MNQYMVVMTNQQVFQVQTFQIINLIIHMLQKNNINTYLHKIIIDLRLPFYHVELMHQIRNILKRSRISFINDQQFI
ncbi:unnamed protein product [Paramecium pentaurelia]|uniref:Uncharacterized protein n=1 Tax=Paramecium pentaurelia TaxID=43138 RepID=A0A8S1SUJ4_9CILI|nr:unnamed protein product [Paramecium pentaurelia]